MKKLRFFWLYSIAVLKRRINIVLIAGLLIAVLITAVVVWKNNFYKPILVEGIVGTFTQNDLPSAVTNLLSKSLVSIDPSGNPKPNLAFSWQSNKESTLYTVKLKDNLIWIDNSPLKAADIALPIPEVDIKILDDKTIQFKIADSFSPFPVLLNKPIFKKDKLIGVGPYAISKISKNQVFVNKISLKSKDKNLPNIIIKFYPNEKIAKNALKLGEVQSLLNISELGELNNQKHLSVWNKVNYQQVVTIFYNTKDPTLSDESLRLALSFKAPSIKNEEKAKTSISPKSWAFNKDVKDYLGNSEQADHYLSKVSNLEKLRSSKDNVIILTVVSSLKNVGEQVVKAWSQLGIKTALRVESGIPQNFQALLITQKIPADPDQYSLWHSTQTQTNLTHFSNPRIDKDLEDGRKDSDMETRVARYQDFQKVLLDHSPATFLYFPKLNVIYMTKVEKNLKKVLNIQIGD